MACKCKCKEPILVRGRGIGISELSNFCKENKYFSSGTANQYDRFIDLVFSDRGITIDEMALIIWICSTSGYSIEEIKEKVEEFLNTGIEILSEGK